MKYHAIQAIAVLGLIIGPSASAAPTFLGTPTVYDNAENEYGQTFIATDPWFSGVSVYLRDPTRNIPSVNELSGPAHLVFYTASGTPQLLGTTKILDAGSSAEGLTTFKLNAPVPTIVGSSYFFGISTSDPYGIGLLSAFDSSYAGGAEAQRDPQSNVITEHHAGRDLSFSVHSEPSPPSIPRTSSPSPVHTVRTSNLTISNIEKNGAIEQIVSVDNFDPNAPTYVVTHGWQRSAMYSSPNWNFSSTPRQEGLEATLASLKERFLDSKYDKDGNLIKANVVLVEWEGAYTGGALFPGENEVSISEGSQLARINADYAGLLLGRALSDRFQKEYEKDIHFIGHSYGTIVNGLAAKYLGKH